MRSVEERYRGSNVRVFRLDSEAVLRRLKAAAEAILADRPEVVEVRLGSLARGEARPGSDADLVVTVSGAAEPVADSATSLLRYLVDVGIGCDLMVYTAEELDRLRREGRRIVSVMETDGVVLARR